MAIQTTMSNWIANFINVEQDTPLTYKGRQWMPALFDTKSPKRLWKMSRQVGKSTGGCAEALGRSCIFGGFNTLYVCPVQDQARKFSDDKIGPMIEASPIVGKHINGKQNKYEKKFANDSKIYLKWAKHNPDNTRGISADFVHYDEIQDQDLDAIEPVIDAVMFTSEHKLRLYSGTPKSLQNPIERKWQKSDQREWLIQCEGCNKHQRLGIRNLGKSGPICYKCGKSLDVDKGMWVQMNPGGILAGFHVNQLNCKISHRTQADWDDILEKFENHPKDTFMNEVLGESADSAEVPLTETVLMKAADDPRMNNPEVPDRNVVANIDHYAGIDWGHGEASTVLVIGRMGSKGKFKNVYMKRYDGTECKPDYCIPDMVEILKRYRVKWVHADTGGGFGLNSRLKDEIPRRKLTTNTWSSSATTKDMRWSSKGREIPCLTMNRSKAIANYIQKIKQGKIKFIKWNLFHPDFSKHFLNIRKERRERDDSIQFVRAGPDDAFHASIYAYIIARADYF